MYSMPSGPNSTAPPLWFANGCSMWRRTVSLDAIGHVRVGRADRVLGDDGVAVTIGVVDEEARVGGVVRVERQAEQAALAAARDPIRDVEERRVEDRPVLDDPDPAALLDDEQAAAPVTGVGDIQRRREPGRPRRSPARSGRSDRTEPRGARRSAGRRGPARSGRRSRSKPDGCRHARGRAAGGRWRRRRRGRAAGGDDDRDRGQRDDRGASGAERMHRAMLGRFGRMGSRPRPRCYPAPRRERSCSIV